MDRKLTLKLNSGKIKQAKDFAAASGTSVSKLVEVFFSYLVPKEDKAGISPLVREISGSISIPQNINEKREYREYLASKHEYEK